MELLVAGVVVVAGEVVLGVDVEGEVEATVDESGDVTETRAPELPGDGVVLVGLAAASEELW